MSDLIDYQSGFREHERVRKLIDLVPKEGETLLDAGARDGSLSVLLAEHFSTVTALDQNTPNVAHARVVSVQGDITALKFADNSFDCVVCAEVLEHIPPHLLPQACSELQRVAASYLVIGVPYRQDIRVSRTTCYSCGQKNPPWGHVNVFDEQRLFSLFTGMDVVEISHVGITTEATNAVAAFLLDLAGNPYGTYSQEEGCIRCGAQLKEPPPRNLLQRLCTKIAYTLNWVQSRFTRARPNWIHILFRKPKAVAPADSVSRSVLVASGAVSATRNTTLRQRPLKAGLRFSTKAVTPSR